MGSVEKGLSMFRKKVMGRFPVLVISRFLLNCSGELLEFHKYLKLSIFRLKDRDGFMNSPSITALFRTVLYN